MKKSFIIFLFVLLLSSCSEQEELYVGQVNDCTFSYPFHDWAKIKNASYSGDMSNVSYEELQFTLDEINKAIFKPLSSYQDVYYMGNNADCETPENECERYECLMFDAIRENNLSYCDAFPDRVEIAYNDCEEGEARVFETLERRGISPSSYTIDSYSCSYMRGWRTRAKITFNNGTSYALYVQPKTHSSGGAQVTNEVDCFSEIIEGENSCFGNYYFTDVPLKEICQAQVSFSLFETIDDDACEIYGRRDHVSVQCYTHKAVRHNDIGYCDEPVISSHPNVADREGDLRRRCTSRYEVEYPDS